MDAWSLPTSLNVHGVEYPIRTDYRVVLDILTALNDPEVFKSMTEEEKAREVAETIIMILYEEPETIPTNDLQEALDRACEFIDCGMKPDNKKRPQVMDWKQDAQIIVPAVNKVSHTDVRSVKYMHWWTFFSLYMEIGNGTFATVVSIRQKRTKGKKLEKWEMEFYKENKSMIDLAAKKGGKRSTEEQEELKALFGNCKK